jgi:adenylate cyclase
MAMKKTEDATPRRHLSRLRQLLSERNKHPERVAAIDQKIQKEFSRKVAILALDMCGFSRLTSRHGVIHFLAMIHQMEQGARPAVTANGGSVVKQEADNLFAIFERPEQAMDAALDIIRAFEAMNTVVAEERAINVSIGIGYGDTLIVEGEDLFGPEMNVACKLGEDVAGKMEILLTEAAWQNLPAGRYACTTDTLRLGGLDQSYYCYQRPEEPGAPERGDRLPPV